MCAAPFHYKTGSLRSSCTLSICSGSQQTLDLLALGTQVARDLTILVNNIFEFDIRVKAVSHLGQLIAGVQHQAPHDSYCDGIQMSGSRPLAHSETDGQGLVKSRG